MHYFTTCGMNLLTEGPRLDSSISRFSRRLLVYLSGKYRDVDEHSVDKNIQRAKEIAVKLWKMGFAVICPHANSQHMGHNGDTRGEVNAFLEGDMVMVERSDLVVMLDNWENSEGAKLERRLAMQLGIPVYYWSVHQESLQRLASNDASCRDARAAILGRVCRLSEITGYRPVAVFPGPVAYQAPCFAPGAGRGTGPHLDSLGLFTERHTAPSS